MLYKGSCNCNRWQLEVETTKHLEHYNPRDCDCNYCQEHPSRVISDPGMSVAFIGEGFLVRQNGDRLANFYHCRDCKVLLAVGCCFDGQLRGAVNSNLLDESSQLGQPVQIQPRLLSAEEKQQRWRKLWGALSGL